MELFPILVHISSYTLQLLAHQPWRRELEFLWFKVHLDVACGIIDPICTASKLCPVFAYKLD